MKRRFLVSAGLAAAIGLGGLDAAFAQAQTPVAPAAPQAAPARGAQMWQRMCSTGPARLAGLLAYTEARIAITDAQRPAWTQFAEQVRASAQPMQRLCAEVTAPPDRTDPAASLAFAERMMTAGLEGVRILRPAVERIMTQLTPEQRTQVAQMLERRGGWGRGGRGWGRHHDGGDRRGPPARP